MTGARSPLFPRDFEDEDVAGTPRRDRLERADWQAGAAMCARRPEALGAVRRMMPYLSAHPEREIAEARRDLPGLWECAACDIATRAPEPIGYELLASAAILKALDAAEAHNAERHPRRFRRSLAIS